MINKFDKTKMTVDTVRVALNAISNMTADDLEKLSKQLKGMDATVGQKGSC